MNPDPATPIAAEIDALLTLADALAAHAPALVHVLRDWRAAATRARQELSPQRADDLAAELRRLWLFAAHTQAQRTDRTPLTGDVLTTPSGTEVPFGYERDLEPSILEQRAASYSPPPPGWSARHLFFGSGQSALTAILTDRITATRDRAIRAAHIGRYFETSDLLELFGAACVATSEHDAALSTADLLILEPTYLGESFCCLDLDSLTENFRANGVPPLIVVDTTLSHLQFEIERLCRSLPDRHETIVVRMASMLKLDQQGMELSNAGLLSLMAPQGSETRLQALADRLVKIRSATGTGLTFANVCALDAPWFLDRARAGAYSEAIFAHNARLARRLDGHALFDEVLHPKLDCAAETWSEAPFVVLTLKQPDPDRYHRLEAVLAERAAEQGILLRQGGSFGFRTHRFETVEPDRPGQPSFLRIALGASPVSLGEAIDLIAGLTEADLA